MATTQTNFPLAGKWVTTQIVTHLITVMRTQPQKYFVIILDIGAGIEVDIVGPR